jgi:AraC-like DNA-binding protein
LPSLVELARRFGCSPFHLSRTFHAVAGLSLRAYAGRLRVRRAAELLAGGASDLSRLAQQLGYADHSHFTHAFRAHWGMPPSSFRDSRSRTSASKKLQASDPTGN